MRAAANHLHYILKEALEVCEGSITSKIKHKLMCKILEEQDLSTGKIFYLHIILQKKPSYGGSDHWILVQDSETKKKWSFFSNPK